MAQARDNLTRLVREPLFQFLLIGMCIYGVYALYGKPVEEVSNKSIRINDTRIDAFVREWELRWDRLPTRQELNDVISADVREEILYRQAIAIGLNKDDLVTRRRMARKLEFLTTDIALSIRPEDGELEQYYEDNLGKFRDPDLITFSHVFLDPDERGNATLDDADLLLARLLKVGEPNVGVPLTGDRFMQPDHYTQVTELDVRRLMGSGFAAAVMQLEQGKWHGPVLSGFGVHLVFVHDKKSSPQPVLADVNAVVFKHWQVEQQEKFNLKFYENLKNTYDIEISEIPEDRILDREADTQADDDIKSLTVVSE